jgi:hypothetical protein
MLFKSDSSSTNTNKHLYEFWTCNTIEWHICFTCNCFS